MSYYPPPGPGYPPSQYPPAQYPGQQPYPPAQTPYPAQPYPPAQTPYPTQPYPATGYPTQPGYAPPPTTPYTQPAYPAYPPPAQPGFTQPGYPQAYPQPGYPQPGYPAQPGMTQPGYGQPKQTYEMILRAVNLDRKDVLSKSDPFLTVYSTLYKTPGPKTGKKHKEAKTGPNPNKIPIHRTETVMNCQNPSWKPFTVDAMALCGGNPDQPFVIEVLDWDRNGAHDLIGRVTTTLREMSVMKELQLINPQKKTRPLYRNSGLLMVDKCVRVS